MATQLTQLELEEISLVDNPANKDAKAVLFKMDKGVHGNKDDDEKDKDKDKKDMEKLTPEETSLFKKVVNALTGSKIPDDQLTNKGDEEMSDKDKDKKASADKDGDLAKAVGTLTETVGKLGSELEFYKAKDAMTEDELKLARAFTPEEEKEFLGLTEEERKAKLKALDKSAKEAEAKEKAEKAGVSEAVIKQIAALEKRAESAETIAKEERDKRLTAEFEKRAEEELPHIPGSVEEKGEMLKALEELPETAKKAALAALKAGDEGLKKAVFTEKGRNSVIPGSSDAEVQLDSLAKAHATEHKMAFAKAYAEVLNTEQGAELYEQVIAH